MQHNIDPKNFRVFKINSADDLYAAIPVAYIESIERAKEEYGNLKDVPPNKTVQGIFLAKTENGYEEPKSNSEQNDITISSLSDNV